MSDSNADTDDAQPATTAFDARRRLRGDYDHLQFHHVDMARPEERRAGGDA